MCVPLETSRLIKTADRKYLFDCQLFFHSLLHNCYFRIESGCYLNYRCYSFRHLSYYCEHFLVPISHCSALSGQFLDLECDRLQLGFEVVQFGFEVLEGIIHFDFEIVYFDSENWAISISKSSILVSRWSMELSNFASRFLWNCPLCRFGRQCRFGKQRDLDCGICRSNCFRDCFPPFVEMKGEPPP